MKEFLLIFRSEVETLPGDLSPEQIQAMVKPWQDWIGGIAAQNKLANGGNRLSSEGKVVKPGSIITDGPYVEMKEAVGGYIIVKTASIDEAAELSRTCPILSVGGNVEIRPIAGMD